MLQINSSNLKSKLTTLIKILSHKGAFFLVTEGQGNWNKKITVGVYLQFVLFDLINLKRWRNEV